MCFPQNPGVAAGLFSGADKCHLPQGIWRNHTRRIRNINPSPHPPASFLSNLCSPQSDINQHHINNKNNLKQKHHTKKRHESNHQTKHKTDKNTLGTCMHAKMTLQNRVANSYISNIGSPNVSECKNRRPCFIRLVLHACMSPIWDKPGQSRPVLASPVLSWPPSCPVRPLSRPPACPVP